MDPGDRLGPIPDGVSRTACCAGDLSGPLDGWPVTPAFAHASEAEMSRILDFYAVRWEYEPDTFPILWNTDGDVVESFSPDFYLPDLDLYLEMTTLRQKLVRKKNRKLRRLRELYPEVEIKLFYARDFRALMLKYGRLALADALSGTSGQVAAPHAGRCRRRRRHRGRGAPPRTTMPTRPIARRTAARPSSSPPHRPPRSRARRQPRSTGEYLKPTCTPTSARSS